MFQRQLLGWLTVGCAVLVAVTAAKAEDPCLGWVVQLGTTSSEVTNGISADSLGNVYVSGYTKGSLFGPNAGYDDAFIAKYDSVGTLLWARQLGTDGSDGARGVSADGLGNVYMSGSTSDSLGGPNAGSSDAFVAKYDSAGTLLWTQQLGTSGFEGNGGTVAADSLGNVYVSAQTEGSLGGPNAGCLDAFIAKYDSAGTLLWTRQLGTSDLEYSYGISTDGLGNVYMSGDTFGSLGGPNAGDNDPHDRDAFVAKYDSAGSLLWTRQLGTTNTDAAFAVSADGPDNVYISGFTRGSLGAPSAGGFDAFVARYDSAGTLLWTRQLGTSGGEAAWGVSADGLGNVYISGYTTSSLDGPNAGGDDVFVAKYDSAGTLLWT